MKRFLHLFLLFVFASCEDASENKTQAKLRTPNQINLEEYSEIELNDFLVTKVASYSGVFFVVSTARYFFDSKAKICPIDMVLFWGDVNELNEQNYSITQSGRWFYSFNLKRSVSNYIANVHIVPSSKSLHRELKRVKNMSYIYLEGYLVNLKNTKTGADYKTSLTRTDTGSGACEIFYITSFRKVQINELR